MAESEVKRINREPNTNSSITEKAMNVVISSDLVRDIFLFKSIFKDTNQSIQYAVET